MFNSFRRKRLWKKYWTIKKLQDKYRTKACCYGALDKDIKTYTNLITLERKIKKRISKIT